MELEDITELMDNIDMTREEHIQDKKDLTVLQRESLEHASINHEDWSCFMSPKFQQDKITKNQEENRQEEL